MTSYLVLVCLRRLKCTACKVGLKNDCKYCLLVVAIVRIQILNEKFAKRVTHRLDEWARLEEGFFFIIHVLIKKMERMKLKTIFS